MRAQFPLLICACLAIPSAAQQASLKVLPTGGTIKAGGYIPKRVTLTGTAPAGLKKAPAGLKAPRYAEIPWGAAGVPGAILILDEPAGEPARLFVDANRNGDLSDDPAVEWKSRAYKARDGKDLQQWMGGGLIQPAPGAAPLRVAMYRFDPNDAGREVLKDVVLYYGDYAAEGNVELGGKSYRILLHDAQSLGDFRGKPGDAATAPRLMIDVNGNGQFDRRGEGFPVGQPFNIAGTTYEIRGLKADGTGLEFFKSDKAVAEVLPPRDLSAGKKALAFQAKTMDGKSIEFPGSFKGKVVLLDFWATWCGPCIVELPHLIAANEKWRSKGLEILGISLDRADQTQKVTQFIQDKKMSWQHVYDGKYWQAAVAELYDVDSIPRAFLVNGDTGEILAAGRDLRGTALEQTLEKIFQLRAR